MRNFLSEDDIEVALLEALMALSPQWERLNAYTYEAGDLNDNTYRDDKAQVVLPRTLQQALRTLNPELPTEAIEQAAAEHQHPAPASRMAGGCLCRRLV